MYAVTASLDGVIYVTEMSDAARPTLVHVIQETNDPITQLVVLSPERCVVSTTGTDIRWHYLPTGHCVARRPVETVPWITESFHEELVCIGHSPGTYPTIVSCQRPRRFEPLARTLVPMSMYRKTVRVCVVQTTAHEEGWYVWRFQSGTQDMRVLSIDYDALRYDTLHHAAVQVFQQYTKGMFGCDADVLRLFRTRSKPLFSWTTCTLVVHWPGNQTVETGVHTVPDQSRMDLFNVLRASAQDDP